MPAKSCVAVVRRQNAVANDHDVDAWAACYSPDATNHGRPAGREGLRAIFRNLVMTFPDLHFELGEIVADGDAVMCESVMSGTHSGTPDLPILGGLLVGVPPTGKRFSVHTVHFYRIAGDEIIEHRAVRDDLGIMQQLGLMPSVTHAAGDISRPVIKR